jgi:hypothetical protein
VKSTRTLCLGLVIALGPCITYAGSPDSSNINDPALAIVNDDLKSLRSTIKREFANQNVANSEVKKSLTQLTTQNDALLDSINNLKSEQEVASKNITENHQALTQFALALSLITILIFLSLWAINQKLKKGITIRFGQDKSLDKDSEAHPEKSRSEVSPTDKTHEDNGFNQPIRDHGISAEEFQKLMSHQISSNTFSLKTSIPVTEKALISATIDAAIEKRMQGFMRPVQPPKM